MAYNCGLLSVNHGLLSVNYGLLSVNYGLLWGMVAYYFQLLGCPGRSGSRLSLAEDIGWPRSGGRRTATPEPGGDVPDTGNIVCQGEGANTTSTDMCHGPLSLGSLRRQFGDAGGLVC